MREDDRISVGLCAGCRHASIVETPRSQFWLCGRAATDPRFARYPRLPILECPGYEPPEGETPGGEPGVSERWVRGAAAGDEIAYVKDDGSSYTRIYRRRPDGSAPTPLLN